MKIHRFYIPQIDIQGQNDIQIQDLALIHQLKNVFRYKIGQIIHIFNEKVGEIEVEISKMDKKDMSLKYIRQTKTISKSKGHKKEVCLYMSIIKNSNFDLVVEKAVELNVSKIVPIITERTIKNNLKFDRLQKIIIEATEQSGRIDLMEIGETLNLEAAIKISKENSDTIYFGHVTDEELSFNSDNKKTTSLFIGPEGGFADDEVKLFLDNKIEKIKLGENVLRAETAAMVGCGLLSL